ncbi:MAG: hypothetical protein KAH57_02420, partial [Thermoplasmata archaeon]|nr:hypothetical protein [Thermoplasmata archaeon]
IECVINKKFTTSRQRYIDLTLNKVRGMPETDSVLMGCLEKRSLKATPQMFKYWSKETLAHFLGYPCIIIFYVIFI